MLRVKLSKIIKSHGYIINRFINKEYSVVLQYQYFLSFICLKYIGKFRCENIPANKGNFTCKTLAGTMLHKQKAEAWNTGSLAYSSVTVA